MSISSDTTSLLLPDAAQVQGAFKRDKIFETRYVELLKFKEEHGHLQVPKGIGLGNWVKNVRKEQTEFIELRRRKNPLKPFQLEKLKEIGFLNCVHQPKATKYFRFLLFNTNDFRKKNGHADFLRKDAVHAHLKWFIESYCFFRDTKKKLGKDRQKQLDDLGISFENTTLPAPPIDQQEIVTVRDEGVRPVGMGAKAGIIARDNASSAPIISSPFITAPSRAAREDSTVTNTTGMVLDEGVQPFGMGGTKTGIIANNLSCAPVINIITSPSAVSQVSRMTNTTGVLVNNLTPNHEVSNFRTDPANVLTNLNAANTPLPASVDNLKESSVLIPENNNECALEVESLEKESHLDDMLSPLCNLNLNDSTVETAKNLGGKKKKLKKKRGNKTDNPLLPTRKSSRRVKKNTARSTNSSENYTDTTVQSHCLHRV